MNSNELPIPPPGTLIIQSFADELAVKIQNALEATKPKQKAARRFLGKYDLERILTERSLEQLFRELLNVVSRDSHPNAGSESLDNIDEYITRTIGPHLSPASPPRRDLLALFLYLGHPDLLFLFMKWLQGGFPSDQRLPFSRLNMEQWKIPLVYQSRIEENQGRFTPKILREGMEHDFTEDDLLPFIGLPQPANSQSKSNVHIANIAPGHWEIKAHSSDSRFIPANPDRIQAVALKIFKPRVYDLDMEDATSDFQAECKVLDNLRKEYISHDLIMYDWGRITIRDARGAPRSHSLIFECASWNLQEFLHDEKYFRDHGYPKQATLLAHLTDVVGALQCLHENLDIYHFDIKPENILVFKKGSTQDGAPHQGYEDLVWKLSDFGLADKVKRRRRRYHTDPSRSVSNSYAQPAKRPAGPFQAPEIQDINSGEASWRSDVWSMGCVALMVLAYAFGGPEDVNWLWSRLTVTFTEAGKGRELLFYVRNGTHQFNDVLHYRYEYLSSSFTPEIAVVTGSEAPENFQAAVHPLVVDWSNILFKSVFEKNQKALVGHLLRFLFQRVLRVDRKQRMKAADFHEMLHDICTQWKDIEDNAVS